jgi:hypothetical protein
MRAITALLVWVASAPGQGATPLLLRTTPDAGKSVILRRTSRQEVDTRVSDARGKELHRRLDASSEEQEYTLAVQEARGGVPVKFTHEYARAVRSRGKEKTVLPWQGRKVRFAVNDGKLGVVSDGVSLERQGELEKAVASRVLDTVLPLLPGKAVKAGEAWEVAPGKAGAGLSVTVDGKASKAGGRLVRLYEKGGVRMAEVELTAALVLGVDGGRLDYRVSIDAAIDGRSTRGIYGMEMTLSGTRAVEEKGRKLTVGGTTRGSVTLEVGEQK